MLEAKRQKSRPRGATGAMQLRFQRDIIVVVVDRWEAERRGRTGWNGGRIGRVATGAAVGREEGHAGPAAAGRQGRQSVGCSAVQTRAGTHAAAVSQPVRHGLSPVSLSLLLSRSLPVRLSVGGHMHWGARAERETSAVCKWTGAGLAACARLGPAPAASKCTTNFARGFQLPAAAHLGQQLSLCHLQPSAQPRLGWAGLVHFDLTGLCRLLDLCYA